VQAKAVSQSLKQVESASQALHADGQYSSIADEPPVPRAELKF